MKTDVNTFMRFIRKRNEHAVTCGISEQKMVQSLIPGGFDTRIQTQTCICFHCQQAQIVVKETIQKTMTMKSLQQ